MSFFFFFLVYSCMCHTTLSSTDLFQIRTNYLLDHAPDPSTFLSPFSYICGHQWTKCIFSCICTTTLHLQLIFSKFEKHIYWTMFQTPVYFHHYLVIFVTTRGPNAFFMYVPYNPQFSTALFPIHNTFLKPRYSCQVIFNALQFHL